MRYLGVQILDIIVCDIKPLESVYYRNYCKKIIKPTAVNFFTARVLN